MSITNAARRFEQRFDAKAERFIWHHPLLGSICLFCVAKRLLGNAPSPFDLHFPMQAAHPFGTLFTR
jgi:hypothetical protein